MRIISLLPLIVQGDYGSKFAELMRQGCPPKSFWVNHEEQVLKLILSDDRKGAVSSDGSRRYLVDSLETMSPAQLRKFQNFHKTLGRYVQEIFGYKRQVVVDESISEFCAANMLVVDITAGSPWDRFSEIMHNPCPPQFLTLEDGTEIFPSTTVLEHDNDDESYDMLRLWTRDKAGGIGDLWVSEDMRRFVVETAERDSRGFNIAKALYQAMEGREDLLAIVGSHKKLQNTASGCESQLMVTEIWKTSVPLSRMCLGLICFDDDIERNYSQYALISGKAFLAVDALMRAGIGKEAISADNVLVDIESGEVQIIGFRDAKPISSVEEKLSLVRILADLLESRIEEFKLRDPEWHAVKIAIGFTKLSDDIESFASGIVETFIGTLQEPGGVQQLYKNLFAILDQDKASLSEILSHDPVLTSVYQSFHPVPPASKTPRHAAVPVVDSKYPIVALFEKASADWKTRIAESSALSIDCPPAVIHVDGREYNKNAMDEFRGEYVSPAGRDSLEYYVGSSESYIEVVSQLKAFHESAPEILKAFFIPLIIPDAEPVVEAACIDRLVLRKSRSPERITKADLSFADVGAQVLEILQSLHKSGFATPGFSLSDIDLVTHEGRSHIVLRSHPVPCVTKSCVEHDLSSLRDVVKIMSPSFESVVENYSDAVRFFNLEEKEFEYGEWISAFRSVS